MIVAFFLVSVLLSCLSPVHSVIDGNISTHVCPESFSCPELAPFKYPFYNVTDTHCGLIKVTCTSKGGKILLGGRSYEIVGKYDYVQNSDLLLIRNQTFEELVNNRSCQALMDNLTPTSPSPLLYSISLFSNITLFKCTKNLTSAQHKDAYFDPHDYKSYNTCKDYTFYYNYLNGTVPSHLPHACQVVHLPLKLPTSPGFDETNIFSLLSSFPSIFFKLPSSCNHCHKRGHQCDTKNAQVRCSNAINDKQGREWARIKNLVIAGSIAILILAFVIFIIWRHCKNNPFSYVSSKKKSPHFDDISLSYGVSLFSYEELEDATQNFSPSHELGDGGFGAVYYGKLQDGREVAVKKLHNHNYNRVQQFINEVELLTKLRHPNLVVLYGCTSRQSSELLLVYEYVSNGTFADHLHGELANPNRLTWPIRMNIAIETASALVYLHASEVIHRDVKTNNILLDDNFCVKVADFGLSRLIPDNATHVSTAPQGTPGYVDPQYHQRYQLTDKSDVYSFGVVLIELISSMVAVDLNRSQDEISLANLALKRIQRHAIDQLIDPNLNTNPEIINRITLVIELAFRCLQYDSDMRPTMNEVLDVLMEIQALGRVDTYVSIKDLQTMNVMIPLSKTNDSTILLKDFLPSPISVTREWQSNNSASSTTLSINGDILLMKNGINT
ncbi:hypothetical protein SSX86_015941 [Deinandra increscens subsp. villosa]|uniref:Protein kinase domain-containing protein n=1 Tax=Deinandra increscens subsp. villosa TaxID=3103831 RepID=A0AAP0GXM4_9ASTR